MKTPIVSKINHQLPVIACYAMVSLMLVCFAATVVNVGEKVFPNWHGGYFMAIAFFVSIQTLVSWRYTEDTPAFTPEWLTQQATDWVVIYIFIKICIYLANGFSLLSQDIAGLQTNLLGSLFSTEVITALIFALGIRMLSTYCAEILALLEHDPDRLDMERKGYFIQDREKIRKNLIGLVFLLGAVQLLLTSLIHLEVERGGLQIVEQDNSVWYLLLYFLCGLALLGLTRFSALRTRWYLQEIPIHRSLALRWGIYCLILLVGVTLISSLLPTRYSVGFLDIIAWIISVISALLAFLQLIILSPIFLLIRWLMSLAGKPEANPPLPIPTLPPPQPQHPQSPIPWLDVLKSIAFWGIFLTVIIFSIVQYLKQREDLIRLFKKTPVLSWFYQFGHWFFGLFRNMNANIGEVVKLSLKRLFAPRDRKSRKGSLFFRPSPKLDSRSQVLYTYLNLIEQNQASPFERKNPDTPSEYASHLKSSLPEAESDIGQLTNAFLEARYTPHAIPDHTVTQAKSSWDRIVQAIRNFREKKQS